MVNSRKPSSADQQELAPLPRLIMTYAPSVQRPWHALCWRLDQRLASVVQRQGDPTIAAIRLAWWDGVLVEQDPAKGAGEPLVEQWRNIAVPDAAQAAERLIDGWRILASPDVLADADLSAYAEARGGGLFGLLQVEGGAAVTGDVQRAGALWALWDLAGHMRDEAQAARAISIAREELAEHGGAKIAAGLPRPLRLLTTIALADVQAKRVPQGGFTLRHYARLLIAGLRG
jgi:hypothetical protein